MKRQFSGILRGGRTAALSFLYAIAIAISVFFSYEIRFDFAVPPVEQMHRLQVLFLVVFVKLVMLFFARQMGSMVSFFGVPDLFRLVAALLASAIFLIGLRFVGFEHISPPRGVLLIDFLVSLAVLCSFRLGARLFRERVLTGYKIPGRAFERVVIVGAGDTGASLVSDLMNMPAHGFRPVAFLDDDVSKHDRFIHGVRVEGAPESFSSLPCLEGVRRAIIAMPSAPTKRIAEIALFLGRLGVQVETVPALEDLASGKARVSRIRPIEIQDLLGRSVVELDTKSIVRFVENKVVMVTGAGGSIGAELCRQIAHLNPSRLLMVEQSEPSLFLIEHELNGLGFSGTTLPLIADILDTARINALFASHAPQIVFHAAAHKHVFLMERQPSEAIKNNSVATRKLAEIAVAHGAEAFVFISTDKAINPTSVMGASKRLAELHLQALQAQGTPSAALKDELPRSLAVTALRATAGATAVTAGDPTTAIQDPLRSSPSVPKKLQSGVVVPSRTKLMAVRFGNVLGSSGSVVPIFKKQIEAGGPVTVTHPDVTRYFMTIQEAVGLVLQASVLGKGGEIFVLDMGQPVKIVSLARNMIELSGFKVGEDIEIKFTSLKPGEKLFEELQHCNEQHLPTEHPRIMRFVNDGDAVKASRMAIEEFEAFVDELSPNELKRNLKVVIPEYEPCFE